MRARESLRASESVTPLEGAELERAIVDFARNASTEVSTHDAKALPDLRAALPSGTTVYVAHTPKATLDQVVAMAVMLQQIGMRASPHLVARRIESEASLLKNLRIMAEAGIEQALLIAGDLPQAVGPYSSTLDIFDSGLLENSSLRHIAIAGHPEGHKQVPDDVLMTALRHKQAFAARTGLKLHIASQFSFDPDAIVAWDERLSQQGITLPAHAGIAGPTPLAKLIKYAVVCGVGASLNSMMRRNMTSIPKLARLATTPDAMLTGLVRGGAARGSSRIVQPHFYAFGGVAATARWIRAVIDGKFRVSPDDDKLAMDA